MNQIVNDRPIIGVLTQPLVTKTFINYGSQYLIASYVKFIEMGGARVVPIFYDMELDKQTEIFNQINGIFLPGGEVDFNKEHQYKKTLYHIWNYVIETNKNDDYFPLWGTCLGLQEIVSVSSNDGFNILDNYPLIKVSLPMEFTNNAKSSKLFSECTNEILKIYQTENVCWHNHKFGISPERFENNNLNHIFNILALNKDSNGKTFISAIEGRNIPVYAVINHPEKVLFNWSTNDETNHSKNSVLANQYLSLFFVNQCKRSNHYFKNKNDESNLLIYNYNPLNTSNYNISIEQIYFFK